MSQSAAMSRYRCKARRKAATFSNETDAKTDNVCCHCGTHINRLGKSSHEKHCHENPMNMKQPAKRGRVYEEVKKNEKKLRSSYRNINNKSNKDNTEDTFTKQYYPGAEFILSLRAHVSIRKMSQKMSSLSKNTCSNEECFGDTNTDCFEDYGYCHATHNYLDAEEKTDINYSSDDGQSLGWEAEDEYSGSEEDDSSLGAGNEDDEFFELPTKFQDVSTKYEAIKHRKPDKEKIAKAPRRYKYRNELSTTQVALVDLANILATRHKVDKKLFDCIASWARFHSNKDPDVWASYGRSNVWSRKKLLRHLSKTFNVEGLKPTSKETVTHDGRRVTIPIFDFAAQVRNILDDPDVMNEDNIMKGLDPKTWRPKLSAEEFEGDYHAIIADKDSGYLYRMGIETHVPDHEDFATSYHSPHR